MSSNFIYASFLGILLAHPALAQDPWPQFRGPGGLGVSRSNPPTRWSATENIAWKTELPGAGTSSPIVVGDRVYLTTFRGDADQLTRSLIAINRKDGTILWQKDIPGDTPEQRRIREDHGYASSTLAHDGARLYAFFGKSGAYAFDLEGKELWRTKLGDQLSDWGSTTSPVVAGQLVIINASVESGSLVALDKTTGTEVWRAKNIRESWNTPILVDVGKKTELVVAVAGKILAFDPATGEPLWSSNTDISWYMAPSLVADSGIIYAIGGRSGIASLAVRAGGKGDVTKTHRLWTSKKGSNVSSPIIHAGHLYFANDSQAIAVCLDAKTGETVYEERLNRADQIYASPVLAGGNVYYTDRGGKTFVVPAQPKFEVLATNDLALGRDRSRFNASPAVAGDQLLIRSDKTLYAIGK